MTATNQYNCIFFTRKGNCKKGGKICELKNLLQKNGSADKTQVQITFLECYQLNSKNSKKTGKQFFRTTFKRLTGKTIKPLSEYETTVLLDILKEKSTRLSCMFQVPENLTRFQKFWNWNQRNPS